MKLKDKVAIVTGGAMGNGLGIVKIFLKHGAKVVILDVDSSLDNVVEIIRKENKDIYGYKVDIRDKKRVDEVIKDIIDNFGRIDILVNNAGVCKLVPFDEMDDEIRDYHFDININGPWNVTKSCIKYLKESKGNIVNLSSVTGPMVADTGEVAYATTKAALIGFTKSLAVEYVKDNVRVNAILPGYIMTPMVAKMAQLSNPENPNAVIDGIASGIPMGRLGTIEELGELAAFLASDEASYITGEGIVISGGSTLPETSGNMGV